MKNLLLLICFLTTSFCTNSKTTPTPHNNTSTKSAKAEIIKDDFKVELLNLVNQLRKEGCRCGRKKMRPVPPVKWNRRLEQSAQGHANDMAKNKFFEHKGSNGSSISSRIEQTGYNWQAVGENIFWGDTNVREAFQGWKDSPSHCKNMMDGSYLEMGAAQSGRYWVQDFGKEF